jgi:eukaryotic-like serine/threonine-protein kinase
MRFHPGDTVGPYRVTGMIGEGSSGVVYQVVNLVSGRLEAIKILADSYSRDLEQAQRFLYEIQLQAKLEHPNIAQVRTAFCEGTTIVLVMELVDGEALNAILRRGPLPFQAAIRVAAQVLNALAMAHHHGVIHRDVKPANILLDLKGAVKLTDFGLAKKYGDPGQSYPGMAVGTAYYMAPEQVRGLEATDWRADLYAVGVVLYEMFTGQRPFDGPEQYAVMRAHVEQMPVPPTQLAPHLPKEVDALLARALAKDPAERFQSATGFLAALKSLPVWGKEERRVPWQYGTYAAGLGALILAAVALPPSLSEPPLETLTFEAPVPPGPARELWQLPPAAPEPAPERDAGLKPKPVAWKRIESAPPPVHREAPPTVPAQFRATRIQAAEITATNDLPHPAAVPAPAASRPVPAALPFAEPPVKPLEPAIEADPTAQKPGHWMRRQLGRVPKLFRRRDSEPQTNQENRRTPL